MSYPAHHYLACVYVALAAIYTALVIVLYRLHRSLDRDRETARTILERQGHTTGPRQVTPEQRAHLDAVASKTIWVDPFIYGEADR